MPSKDTQFKKGNIPWNKGMHQGQNNPRPETLFQKGHLPWNTKSIGSEKIDKDGYVRVKTSNDKNRCKAWQLKHHIIFKNAYPDVEIKKTDRIIFLDGNKRNFDINNLKLVTRREQMELSRWGDTFCLEEKLALIQLIRLRNKLLDMGVDKVYNYMKEYIKLNPEKKKKYACNACKRRREKRKYNA
jgi:hypothetical protein